jgi:hypothetical protein
MNDVAFVHMTLAVVSLQTKERINALLERNGEIRREFVEEDGAERRFKRRKRMYWKRMN